MAVLNQPQYSPMDVSDQILILFAVTKGYLADVPVENVKEFEKEFINYIHDKHRALLEKLDEKKELTDDILDELVEAINTFKNNYKF